MQNAERKKVVRKSRSEDGVWTDGNSGMKAEGTQYADADPRGRFPANVMHDGSDVISKEFPQQASLEVLNYDKQKNKCVFGKYNEVKSCKHMMMRVQLQDSSIVQKLLSRRTED